MRFVRICYTIAVVLFFETTIAAEASAITPAVASVTSTEKTHCNGCLFVFLLPEILESCAFLSATSQHFVFQLLLWLQIICDGVKPQRDDKLRVKGEKNYD